MIRVFREWWMGDGSRAIEITHDTILYFELNTKIHQFTVKKIHSFNGNFNKYNERGDILFQVTKKKGLTIIRFFQMLENQEDPGNVENSFENPSREIRSIFRRQDVERNFDITRIYDNEALLRLIENNLENTPEGDVLEDFEENLDITRSLRTVIEDSLEDNPDCRLDVVKIFDVRDSSIKERERT